MAYRNRGVVLKQQMKGIGFAARWGGEEFLLIFPRKNGDEALQLVYGIQSQIRNIKIPCENGIITVTMTFGLTEYDFNSELDYNIMEADNKLYLGKDSESRVKPHILLRIRLVYRAREQAL